MFQKYIKTLEKLEVIGILKAFQKGKNSPKKNRQSSYKKNTFKKIENISEKMNNIYVIKMVYKFEKTSERRHRIGI